MHVAKAFYFLFFGAFGSLFPLLAVYFKVFCCYPSYLANIIHPPTGSGHGCSSMWFLDRGEADRRVPCNPLLARNLGQVLFFSYLLTFSFPDKFLSTSISIVRLGTLTAIPNKIRSSLKKVLTRFQAGKVLMLLAITSWVAFTLPIGYIHPPVVRYFSSDILRFFITIH